MVVDVADINLTRTIVAVSCGVCHVLFGMEKAHHQRASDNGTHFFCPNGHEIWYSETETGRLKRELVREKQRTEQANAEIDSKRHQIRVLDKQVAARKGIATRLKRKLSAGRCPCCSHKFKELAVHMKTEHPNFDPEKAASALAKK